MSEFYVGFCPSWRSLIIRDTRMNPNTKLVLLVIAEFTSGMGRMQWPTKPELMELTGLTKANVETALKYAREWGYLQFRRDVKGGDCEYEPRVPVNPVVMDLWTPAHKGQSGPVFTIPGKDILAEVLDAVACHALIDALAESRIPNVVTPSSYTPEPEEADGQEVEEAVQRAPGEAAPQEHGVRNRPRWS